MDKHALRKQFLEKRNAFSRADIHDLSLQISEQFTSVLLEGVSYIHLFYPIAEKLEVNTLLIEKWLRNTHPEIKLVLSKSNLQDHSLSHVIWEYDTPLAKNRWGITEPVSGPEVRPDELDMVLVPLLAYDVVGNRIGYGKGFYDRFLSECREDVQKIGLSFFEPENQIEDIHDFDIKINMCITPNKIWRF